MSKLPLRHKIVLLGNSYVGKTCLAVRFAEDSFKGHTSPTLCASFFTKLIKSSDGSTYQVDLWDTAGQERYKSLTHLYYRGAAAAIIVYDVTDPASLTGVREWVTELHSHAAPTIIIALFANKIDLPWQVDKHLGAELAAEYSFLYEEVSAKTGDNVESAFERLVSKIPLVGKNVDGLALRKQTSTKGCCY